LFTSGNISHRGYDSRLTFFPAQNAVRTLCMDDGAVLPAPLAFPFPREVPVKEIEVAFHGGLRFFSLQYY
jgi:hypothetical protein